VCVFVFKRTNMSRHAVRAELVKSKTKVFDVSFIFVRRGRTRAHTEHAGCRSSATRAWEKIRKVCLSGRVLKSPEMHRRAPERGLLLFRTAAF